MALKRIHVIVEGRVQGVFFRAYTKEEADKLQLNGWVRNQENGSVEALIEGEPEAVSKMIAWFYGGSPMSKITNVTTKEEDAIGEHDDFSIHYY